MPEWTHREEVYLKKLHLQCLNMYSYYNKLHLSQMDVSKRFNIPIMVLSAINSLLALTLAAFIDQAFVSIINAIISAGVGILSSILLFLKVNEKITLSQSLSMKMNILALKISKELGLDKDHRTLDGTLFLNECFQEYLVIIDKSFPLDRKVKNYLTIDDLVGEVSEDSTISSNDPPVSPLSIVRQFSFNDGEGESGGVFV